MARCRLHGVLLAALGLLLQTLTGTPLHADGDDAAAAPTVTEPIGLTIRAEMDALDLSWVRGPGSTARIDGYLIYYEEADAPGAEFRTVKSATTSVRIEGLRPDIEYSVQVCAGTPTFVEGLQRKGEWYISRRSESVTVRTMPDYRLRLVGGSAAPAGIVLVQVERFRDGTWYKQLFPVKPGEHIGHSRIVEGGKPVDFTTPWTLASARLVQRRRARETLPTGLPGPWGAELTDSTGKPVVFRFPTRGPTELLLEAVLTAPPAQSSGDPRTRVLLQGH